MQARAIASTLTLVLVLLSHARPGACSGPGSGVVAGRIVDWQGKPLGFIDVALEPEEGYTFMESFLTEPDGTFRFADIPIGNYKLAAYADGLKAKELFTNIGVTPQSSQSFTITLVPIASVNGCDWMSPRIPDVLAFSPSSRREMPGGRVKARPRMRRSLPM